MESIFSSQTTYSGSIAAPTHNFDHSSVYATVELNPKNIVNILSSITPYYLSSFMSKTPLSPKSPIENPANPELYTV